MPGSSGRFRSGSGKKRDWSWRFALHINERVRPMDQRDLPDNGVVVGIHRTRRIRRKLSAEAEVQGHYRLAAFPARRRESIWDQKFDASAPNRIWLSDINYIPTGEGRLYLAGHKDLFTGGDEEPGHPILSESIGR
jgi:transposase InsO family protein